MIQRFISHPTTRQFVRFSIVGFANTAVDWIIFFSLTSWVVWFADRPLLANALAFAGGFSNSFLLNRRWTFRSADQRRWQQASRFLVVALVGLGLSELIVGVFLPVTNSRVLSKAAAVILVLSWNFIGGKLWAFKAVEHKA